MGSTDKEDAGIVDCGVGSIVWVRRRNGSWWPGKILGAAELSAANLVSPRSGTPVKLLGREDASVDWYNLEKSKRVKPFRCGEFDQCIERAESALGMPPKKREKYARREDAILHALELEKQLLDDKPSKLDSPVDGYSSKYSATARKEKVISPECSSYENKKNLNPKPDSKKPVVAIEDEDIDDHIDQQEANEASQMGGNVDTSELLPRIRVSLEQKRKLPDDDVLTLKSLVKRRDRRRNLVQVLQKSEKLSSLYLPSESNDCSDEDEQVSPIPMAISPSHLEVDGFSRPTGLDEESASESTESTETDSSKTLSMDSDKDDGIASPEPALVPESEPTSLEISGQAPHGSLSGELPTGNDFSHLRHHDLVPTSFGISKWQIKGKRNNRSLSRRSTEATDRWVARGSMYTAHLKEAETDGLEESDMIERKLNTQRHPYHNQKYTSNPKASFKGYDDVSRKIIDWDSLAWNEQPLMRGYRDDTRNYRMKSGFVDVDLKVQSSYQREHVPLISLRSKLNGKAIVGHPIQVEILESGSTDSLLSSANAIGVEVSDNGTVVPPVWRTARRSANFRVPRSQQSMTSVSKKGPNKKVFKQPPKKMILPSNQKVRNLSAIGGREQIFGNSSRYGNTNSFRGGGLIKGEAGPTTVACIPVKLVFCRLNEGLVGRHQ